MRVKFKVLLLLFSSAFFHAQEVNELLKEKDLESLRSDLVDRENSASFVMEDIQLENSIEANNTKISTNDTSDYFGFSFFDVVSATNTPLLDLPLQSDYEISLNDNLELLLVGEKNVLIDVRVDLSGNILVPEVGKINLRNLSLTDAEKKVNSFLSESYIGTKAFLNVKEASMKKISVIGSVASPGTYFVNPFVTVSEAIKYANGLTQGASLRNIKINRIDGSSINIDMYNFLIDGNLTVDQNLRNGDTVIVPATSNFVTVNGQVHRPKIYEYKSEDRVEKLLSFAQGLTNNANMDNISVNFVRDNVSRVEIFDKSETVGNRLLSTLYVGSNVSQEESNYVEVRGDSVSQGSYAYESGDNLSSLLEKIIVSEEVYPFYAILKQKDGFLGEKYNYFSLFDEETYQSITLESKPEIYFFSKEDVKNLSDRQITKKEKNQVYTEFLEVKAITKTDRLTDELLSNFELDIRENDLIFIETQNKDFLIPVTGRIVPKLLLDYFGLNRDVVNEISFVSGTNVTSKLQLNELIKSEDINFISFNDEPNKFITVRINGSVVNGGEFNVPLGTTLQDLYEIAGGFTKTSFVNGIFFSRERIKNTEKKALQAARKILLDTYIQSANNPMNSNNQFDSSVLELLNSAENIEVAGRLTGDFEPDSFASRELILEAGDSIFIPSFQSEISISGEVLNPSTVSFDSKLSYEDYVNLSGGYTEYANVSSAYVIKANGTSVPLSRNYFSNQIYPDPGDLIVIPRDYTKLDTIPLLSTATKIIADIAFAAASLNAIQN
tara:strand:+ start:6676 stop:9018 length:2343 start_codon:yes stop_codon:yes gene_type:complete